jgi:hypothetical protein
MNELFQLAIASDDPNCRTTGVEQMTGSLDHPMQDHGKAQLGSYRGVGAQQPAQPALDGEHITRPVTEFLQQDDQLQPPHLRELQTSSG